MSEQNEKIEDELDEMLKDAHRIWDKLWAIRCALILIDLQKLKENK